MEDKLLFKGEYEHTVDDKNRAFIPAKFRDGLGESFVVCKGFFDQCLYVLPNQVFQALSDKLAGESLFDESIAKIQRELYANSADVELDKQGRIVIPQKLRDFANIQKEISIIGVGTRIEIWNKQAWQSMTSDPNGMKVALRNMQAKGKSI